MNFVEMVDLSLSRRHLDRPVPPLTPWLPSFHSGSVAIWIRALVVSSIADLLQELTSVSSFKLLRVDVEPRMSSFRAESRREPLDCVVRLVTPERIVIGHPLAGPSRRLMAYLVDQVLLLVLVVLAFLLFQVLTMGSPAAFGPALVAYFVLTWGYGAFCEGLFNGQTVGKRAMEIRVISDPIDVPISGAQAVLHALSGAKSWLVPFFLSNGPGEHDSVTEISAAGRSRRGYNGCRRRAAAGS